MGSEGEMGMNFEFRVQKAQPPAAPALPRTAVWKTFEMKPMMRYIGGEKRERELADEGENRSSLQGVEECRGTCCECDGV
jgi:hypothetical protein